MSELAVFLFQDWLFMFHLPTCFDWTAFKHMVEGFLPVLRTLAERRPGVAHCFPVVLFLSNLPGCKQTNKHKSTSSSVYACLPSKSVLSHTQASSKNGLFHLTQVMTAAPAAAAVWPTTFGKASPPLSYRSAFIPTRMDTISRPPILHSPPWFSSVDASDPLPSSLSLSWLQIWWQWMSFSPHWVLGRLSSPIKWNQMLVQK